jgi:transcriptional regulator with XRE-family HTH domain
MEAMKTLGEQMRDRREELRLSQSAAARAAGVARTTWVNWEKDKATPERFNYAAIDDTLEWERKKGVDAVRAGGEPVARRKEHGPPPIPDGVLIDPADWAIMTPDERTAYVRIVTGVRRRRGQQASRGA